MRSFTCVSGKLQIMMTSIWNNDYTTERYYEFIIPHEYTSPIPVVFYNDCQKADSHIACRAHSARNAVLLPCRAAKSLECVFPTWFTQCGRVWFTLAMPLPCHALTMPFFSRPRHSTAVERRPVGYLYAFGFFRLPRWVPRRLLSEAYQSSSQQSIPTTVKRGSSTLQKRRCVKLLD